MDTELIMRAFIIGALGYMSVKATYIEIKRSKILGVRDAKYWFGMATDLSMALIGLIILFNLENKVLSSIPLVFFVGLPLANYGWCVIRDVWNLITQDVCHVAVHFIVGRFRVRVKDSTTEAKRFLFTWYSNPIPTFTRDRVLTDFEFSLNDLVKLVIICGATGYLLLQI